MLLFSHVYGRIAFIMYSDMGMPNLLWDSAYADLGASSSCLLDDSVPDINL